ncbi:MAG TPA: Holliday junction branch migration protein RuvA [Microbacteriaceae bacterium]|nr:Holliday junction branch migration protein RuvA [Microbacteriaceae bacterium]
MISSLRGTAVAVTPTAVELEVGGVGYTVAVTPRHASRLRVGAEALVYTRLVMRADAVSLYGFVGVDERAVFDLLTGVNGVGPKSAMGVLTELSPAQIGEAVAREDDAAFRAVSGIGTKTAKLIVVQLTGKMEHFRTPSAGEAAPAAGGVDAAVVEALVGLGWPERVARETVEEARGSEGADADVPTLLRLALRRMVPGARPAERVAR